MSQESATFFRDLFDFTDEDLAANRIGQATEHQRERIKKTVGKSQAIILLLVGFVLLIFFGAFFLAPRFESIREQIASGSTDSVIIIAGVGGSLLLYLLVIGFALLRNRSSASGSVRQVQGKFKTIGGALNSLDGNVYQRVKFGRAEHMLKAAQADAFVPGQDYTIYVAGPKRFGHVLSVETPGDGGIYTPSQLANTPRRGSVSPLRRLGGLLMLLIAISFGIGLVVAWDILGQYIVKFEFLGWDIGFLGARLFVGFVAVMFTIWGTQNLLARADR